MRKPRDFDAELKALGTRRVTSRTVRCSSLGELVIVTGADALNANEIGRRADHAG